VNTGVSKEIPAYAGMTEKGAGMTGKGGNDRKGAGMTGKGGNDRKGAGMTGKGGNDNGGTLVKFRIMQQNKNFLICRINILKPA